MPSSIGTIQPTLADAGRLRRIAHGASISSAEIAVLALAGAAAACCDAWIHLGLKIPGHAILRAIFPMMIGLSLVPRRGAGATMGVFAALTAIVLNRLPGEGISLASGVSMTLVGPSIDIALSNVRSSRWLYARFVLAGVLANILALNAKVLAISAGLLTQKEPLATYLVRAVPSYILCGAIAGLIGGAICFRARSGESGAPSP